MALWVVESSVNVLPPKGEIMTLLGEKSTKILLIFLFF